MRHLPALLALVLLVGCTTQAKYDIDVSCSEEDFGEGDYEEGSEKYFCLKDLSTTFHVKCDKKTVQHIEGDIHCSTHDGKSVRININQ